MSPCIFCKIVAGDLPSSIIYEDEHLLAFLDIHPVHKGHTLLLSKKHFESTLFCDDEILQRLALVAKNIAHAVMKGVNADGCNISSNNGSAAGQEVFHMHWHIIPRFAGDNLNRWEHGKYGSSEEQESIAKQVRDSFAN